MDSACPFSISWQTVVYEPSDGLNTQHASHVPLVAAPVCVSQVVGSADVLGNPVGLVANLWLGVSDFFIAPIRALAQDPRLLPSSLRQGSASFLRSTVFAVSDSVARIAHAAAKAVASLAIGNEQLQELQLRRLEAQEDINVLGAILEVGWA